MMRLQGFRYDRLLKTEYIVADIFSNLVMKHNFDPDTLKIIDVNCDRDIYGNEDMFYVEVIFEGERFG